MELTCAHRRAFLDELDAAQKDEQQIANCIQGCREASDFDTADAFESKHYLAQQRIKTIQSALIENNIDY